jgi:hypothetical protein
MAEDLFEKLRASKPLNVPEAKEKYDSVGVVLIGLRSTGGEAFEHLRDGALKTGGQAARRAGMGAKAPLTLAKNFRPGPDLVLGIAFDAMKQSNNSVTKATGLVFDTALAGLTFRMLVGANPVGAAAILAFELYNTAETILKWMEEREQQKLAKE